MNSYQKEFFAQYVETALWSSTDENGEPLDSSYGFNDVSPETLEKMKADCLEFLIEADEFLADMDAGQAGHDFWLTRCGHGAGFWDRGLGEVGEKLTEISKGFGSVDLYVCDDGKVYSGI